MRVEWDREKDRTNLAKHGVGFEQAAGIFHSRHLSARIHAPVTKCGWSLSATTRRESIRRRLHLARPDAPHHFGLEGRTP
jgi:hypothetical protein